MNERHLINDICDVGSSKRIYLSEYQDSGIPFYRGKEIIEKDSNKDISNELFISRERYNEIKEKFGVPQKGDILMTAVGTIGISWYVDEENFYFKDGNLIWFKNFKKDIVNSRYLYYIFKSRLFSEIIKNISIGSTQKAITIEQVKKIELEFPKIEIQNKIVKVLDNINNKIKLNNEINNNLYELIKNNYEALISNFDWEEVELGTIANITSGKRPVDKLETGAYPVIGANGIMAYTNDFNFNEDLIITGRVGTLGVVRRYAEQIWASDNTLVIQTKYLNYIENYMKTIDYYSLNRGSTQPLLTQGDLKKQIIMFNEEAVLRFEEENQIFVDKIKNNEKENKNLEQLRDTLLPKLMNGEIDLDNIEI